MFIRLKQGQSYLLVAEQQQAYTIFIEEIAVYKAKI